jgi:ferritin
LIQALNQQVSNEMQASLQYISLAHYFEIETLLTLSRFFHRHAEEERQHAMKFVQFLADVDAELRIPAISDIPYGFQSVEDAVQRALQWEETVTRQIHDLMHLAIEEKTLLAQQFLEWFINEQQEEENVMSSLLSVVRRAGPDRLLDVEAFLVRENWVAEGTPLE